jgi:cell pole-organizing protein PopZ
MSDTNAQEPTMEEILASIRRIISEDDAPAAAAPATEPEPEPEAEPPPSAAAAAAAEPHDEVPAPAIQSFDEEDDVLELTEPAPPMHEPEPAPAYAAPVEALGDLEVSSRAAPAPAPPPYRPEPVAASADAHDDEGLIGHSTADRAATAFGQLSRTLAMPAEGRTLEDVVRELLRPMLKDWLDRNLSGIVETAVQSEVERISRLRRF